MKRLFGRRRILFIDKINKNNQIHQAFEKDHQNKKREE